MVRRRQCHHEPCQYCDAWLRASSHCVQWRAAAVTQCRWCSDCVSTPCVSSWRYRSGPYVDFSAADRDFHLTLDGAASALSLYWLTRQPTAM